MESTLYSHLLVDIVVGVQLNKNAPNTVDCIQPLLHQSRLDFRELSSLQLLFQLYLLALQLLYVCHALVQGRSLPLLGYKEVLDVVHRIELQLHCVLNRVRAFSHLHNVVKLMKTWKEIPGEGVHIL